MTGRVRRAGSIAMLRSGTGDELCLFVGVMPSGDIVRLSGSALAIWDAIIDLGDEDQVIEQLAADYAVPIDEMREAVTSFVHSLVEQSLLERFS